jgi:regulation of enolase protein 1 (concanavalin A-like superfamily)
MPVAVLVTTQEKNQFWRKENYPMGVFVHSSKGHFHLGIYEKFTHHTGIMCRVLGLL